MMILSPWSTSVAYRESFVRQGISGLLRAKSIICAQALMKTGEGEKEMKKRTRDCQEYNLLVGERLFS